MKLAADFFARYALPLWLVLFLGSWMFPMIPRELRYGLELVAVAVIAVRLAEVINRIRSGVQSTDERFDWISIQNLLAMLSLASMAFFLFGPKASYLETDAALAACAALILARHVGARQQLAD